MCICEQVKDNCWNLFDSYGEICVHCGCCSENPAVKYAARLNVTKRELYTWRTFDDWAYGYNKLLHVQHKNIRSNIKSFGKDVRKYRRKVKLYDAGKV